MDRNEGTQDVRELLTPEYHANAHAAATNAAEAPVEIRLAEPKDADNLARCFYRAYGGSYDHAWVYKPHEIGRRWSEQGMVSVVGLAPSGEVIGHLAASFTRRGARVAETGQAVVDPRYRGHHLFESMKKWLAAWAGQEGLYGLFSEATAAHPYSQRGNLALGAHVMGFLIGYIPSSVDYKQIDQCEVPKRKTAALMYLRTGEEPKRMVHLPSVYRDIAMRIYGNSGFSRIVGTGKKSSNGDSCRAHLHRDYDHNAALLHCKSVGADTCATIATHLEALETEAVDCIYLDLPLSNPNVFIHGAAIRRLGFVFGCILPEIRDDGDVLRLQRLNGVELHIDEIATASDFGRELLVEIAADFQKKLISPA